MKTILHIIILTAIPALLAAQDLSPREVMEKMEDNRRATTNSALSKMQLSTCRYGIRNSKITCAEKPRVKSLESVGKGYGENLRDTRSVAILLAPANERGIGMLSYAYDDASRDNESWLYLSALGRVKRIASGSSDDETEPGSLFGSEFTTDDMDTGKLDEYEISFLDDTTQAGRDVWKIQMIPNAERARKTRYSKLVMYIDKERFVELRVEMYDQYDKEVKRLLGARVEMMNGIWVARSITMMNLVANRLSNMAFLEMHTGIDVPDEFLTQRTLTDAAFREAELEKLRSQID
jgi:hypothetical protein